MSPYKRIYGFFALWGNELVVMLMASLMAIGCYWLIRRFSGDAPFTPAALMTPAKAIAQVCIYSVVSWMMAFVYTNRIDRAGVIPDDISAQHLSWRTWAVFMVCFALVSF